MGVRAFLNEFSAFLLVTPSGWKSRFFTLPAKVHFCVRKLLRFGKTDNDPGGLSMGERCPSVPSTTALFG